MLVLELPVRLAIPRIPLHILLLMLMLMLMLVLLRISRIETRIRARATPSAIAHAGRRKSTSRVHLRLPKPINK